MPAEHEDARASRLWGMVLLFILAADLIFLLIDRKMKNDIIAESKKLREEIARVRRGETSPADQADRGGPVDRDHPVDDLPADPPAPPPAVEDEMPSGHEQVDGDGRPPHRGGINAS
jgi:hypothetical protein